MITWTVYPPMDCHKEQCSSTAGHLNTISMLTLTAIKTAKIQQDHLKISKHFNLIVNLSRMQMGHISSTLLGAGDRWIMIYTNKGRDDSIKGWLITSFLLSVLMLLTTARNKAFIPLISCGIERFCNVPLQKLDHII